MKDFITAALPWVLIGLSLAVLPVITAQEKQSSRKSRIVKGGCIGFCIGTLIYVVLGWALWVSMLIGMVIGLGSFASRDIAGAGKKNSPSDDNT